MTVHDSPWLPFSIDRDCKPFSACFQTSAFYTFSFYPFREDFSSEQGINSNFVDIVASIIIRDKNVLIIHKLFPTCIFSVSE